jgi:hypothetical protein
MNVRITYIKKYGGMSAYAEGPQEKMSSRN